MERKFYKFNPAEQRVLVLPDEGQETKTAGGIIIPDSKETKPNYGRVIAVGKGCLDTPMAYVPGQYVMYSQYAGTDITLNLVEGAETFDHTLFKVMNQTDIWGTLNERV